MWEYFVYFPFFHPARLGQKIRRSPQLPLCGVALRQYPTDLSAPGYGGRAWPFLSGMQKCYRALFIFTDYLP